MAPPAPPKNLHQKQLPTATLGAGRVLYRIQDVRYKTPVYFGRDQKWRFDAPHGSYGVCYLSESKAGAFVETIARHKLTGDSISTGQLKSLAIYRFELRASLVVVELHGSALLALGADASISSSHDYTTPQRWSSALHSHPALVDGIRYRARHDNSKMSVALFDRCASPAPWSFRNLGSIFKNAEFLAQMIKTYDLDLIEG